ncbi:MAG: hypothetical protein HYV60_15280, partial [Planctomycetia bacterium]|nr:hypothetical protein [Planctomycetia bacterium]
MNRRILIVDDTESIHDDFKSILSSCGETTTKLSDTKAALLGVSRPRPERVSFELVSAFQGAEALELVRQGVETDSPFSLAFVDVRMPPGWDGVKTLERIWEIDPTLQAVICTAFSDYSWDDMIDRFGNTDRLLILRKPFDNMEVRQLASALTRKWRLEHDAQSQMQHLSDLVRDRTKAITQARDELLVVNKQLEAARIAAEEASQAKSAFLANMSHEIRTPMTAILGYADVLLSDGDITLAPHDRVQAIDTIRRNGSHLLQLINDLLDISKIEANELTVERLFFSPIEVTADAIELMNVRARERGLTLSIEIEGEIPELIYSDPTRLRQILINLIGNAIKFTDKGHVRVTLGCVSSQTGQAFFQLRIVDTGIGLSDEQIRKLFTPFSQADASTTRKYGGTGLGLSISKHLAQTLGGDIEVFSEIGKGSEFRVTVDAGALTGVRMIRQQFVLPDPEQPARRTEEIRPVRLSGRILLAEDGLDTQRLFPALL